MIHRILALLAFSIFHFPFSISAQHDLVIANGRAIDPESGLDAPRHVGIDGGKITAISATPLDGKETIDATGLTVTPGFIDLHQHGWDPASYEAKARDGVTSILELEVGTGDIPKWYATRAKEKLPIHYGVSIGHIPSRMKVFKEFPVFLPPADSKAATEPTDEKSLAALEAVVRAGLDAGAPAVGFGLAYTPAASSAEVIEIFRIAAEYDAPCHVHLRNAGDKIPGAVEGLSEVIAASAITGAPLHVVHINSSGRAIALEVIDMLAAARARGIRATVECYPYTAGMTDISSAIFDEGFREKLKVDYGDLQWGATGERLTEETFKQYRATGGLVIVHSNPEELVRNVVAHPATIIASDGLVGHPRNYGTYSRILGKYAREDKAFTLMTALRKITLMPARVLETRVPAMRKKGRLQLGCDADLAIFDPATIIDKATFLDAKIHSEGVHHLLVNGTPVVRNGKFLGDVTPGMPIRAPER